jgi:hypothetical protein
MPSPKKVFATMGATSGNAITKSVCYKGSNKCQCQCQKHLPQGEQQVECHHQKHFPQREQQVAMPSAIAFATRGATSGNAVIKGFATRRATGVDVIIEERPPYQLIHGSHSCCHHLSHPVTILATIQPSQPILH